VLGIILQKKEAENIVSSIFLTNEWKGEEKSAMLWGPFG
jgi:hypothetical protein